MLHEHLHGQPGYEDQRDERQHHGHCAEGEQLDVVDGVVPRVVDNGWQPQELLPARESDQQRHNVSGQRPVRVAVLLEVYHHQQLREQDHVHQVRAHRPVGEYILITKSMLGHQENTTVRP